MARVLIVDDNPKIVKVIKDRLTLEKFEAEKAHDMASTFQMIASFKPDVVILDVFLEQAETGLDILEKIRETWTAEALPVFILTGEPDSALCKKALQLGADYSSKSGDIEELIRAIKHTVTPAAPPPQRAWKKEISGSSVQMIDLTKKIYRAAQAGMDTLFLGETGTGKDLAAYTFHQDSARRIQPLVTIDCTVIPEDLFETQMFGASAGVFTGAQDKAGRIADAQGGILFLNEIGELNLSMQAKLLTFLETKKYRPLGKPEQTLDAVILAATNRDLKKMVEQKEFRKDLYFRLMKNVIEIPPLREHKEDIEPLIRYFIKKFNSELGKRIQDISREAMTCCLNHTWEGNVRELSVVVLHAMHQCQGHVLNLEHVQQALEHRLGSQEKDGCPLVCYVDSYQLAKEKAARAFHRDYLLFHLNQHNWNRSLVAETIGITPRYLNELIKKYTIENPA